MRKWVIKDKVLAKYLGIDIIESKVDNILTIDISCIPKGITTEEFILDIQERGIVKQMEYVE
jgi:hypothetical protein